MTKTLDLSELVPWVESLVGGFAEKQIVLLSGPLAAGKTKFVEVALNALGGNQVASPTYAFIHDYKTPENRPIFHCDLYRVEDEDELASIGFWDLFDYDSGVVFVEWPERLNLADLPLDWAKLKISISLSASEKARDYLVQSL